MNSAFNQNPALRFRPGYVDSGLFEIVLSDAAQSDVPVYLGTIELPRARLEQLCEEGRQRAEENRKRLGNRWKGHRQALPGCPYTVDELGRICEGAVEDLIPLQSAAVVRGAVDERPDVDLEGISFDIKGAYARPGYTFSVAHYLATKYEALVLVMMQPDGTLHVWAVRCRPENFELRRGVNGGADFYLVRCPAPTKTLH